MSSNAGLTAVTDCEEITSHGRQKSTSHKLGYDDWVQTSFSHSPETPRTVKVREVDIYTGIANPGFFSGRGGVGVENLFFFVIRANPVS